MLALQGAKEKPKTGKTTASKGSKAKGKKDPKGKRAHTDTAYGVAKKAFKAKRLVKFIVT